jgi:hypothetical protein
MPRASYTEDGIIKEILGIADNGLSQNQAAQSMTSLSRHFRVDYEIYHQSLTSPILPNYHPSRRDPD